MKNRRSGTSRQVCDWIKFLIDWRHWEIGSETSGKLTQLAQELDTANDHSGGLSR